MRFSPSTLNLFLDCPRCFWLHVREGIRRPSGPFPSLPGGIDGVLKTYFDAHRQRGALPVELEGKVPGKLYTDLVTLRQWRNWRQGLRWDDAESGAQLSGALDDCLVDENGNESIYYPLDYKTRGSEPKENSHSFYQNQLNCYALLLEENGYRAGNEAVLAYYHPLRVDETDDRGTVTIPFVVTVKRVPVNTDRARGVVRDAAKLLTGPIPPRHATCNFCHFSSPQ